ncbi:8004_t:CDS:2, partial [Cetraspora pellucida]
MKLVDYTSSRKYSNYNNILQLGFICTSGNSSSGIQTSLSTAITIAYNMIFKTKTTFSGPAVIVVSHIGDDMFNGFISSLITKKGKNGNRYLVQQQIVNNKFILDFYKGTDLEFHYEDKNALDVWKKTKLLAKYDRISLFGYLYSSVKQEQLTKSIIGPNTIYVARKHAWLYGPGGAPIN